MTTCRGSKARGGMTRLRNNFISRVFCLCLVLQCCHRAVKSDTTEQTTETSLGTAAVTVEMVAQQTPPQTAMTVVVTTTTTTQTVVPTEKPIRKTPMRLSPSDRCFCDLTRNSCDVECCCDVDCTEEDAKSFASCVDRVPENHDLRYCVRRDLIFASRTLFEKRPVGDLLCIVVDNVRKKDVFREPPAVSTPTDVHKLVGEARHDWAAGDAKQTAQVRFKAGDALLRVGDEGGVGEWRLPTRLFSTGCEATEAVTYLRDQALECTRSVGPLGSSCMTDPALSAQTYHRGFGISSSADDKVQVHPTLCSSGACSDFLPSAHLPSYTDEGECRNVVSRVTYRIVHSGIHGISNITARYETITLRSGDTEFVQRFSTSYVWSSGGASLDAKRSGNPGYLRGLPIPAGCFKTDGTRCNHSVARMWMTVPDTENGDCASLTSEVLKFGSNLRTGCLAPLAAFRNCTILRKVVFDYLVGESLSLTHVAMFGNSSRSEVGEHVPVLRENVPSNPVGQGASVDDGRTCKLGATDVRVFVLYARTEHAVNPQNKIVSVLYRYGGTTEVKLSHLPTDQQLEVTFVATFVDISQKAARIFAPPPTLEAHLPEDFFYPFFLDSGSGKCHRCSDQPNCRILLFTAVVFLLVVFETLQQM
ncbi:unnamed protein product [Ixodes hexagonus]